MKFINSKLRRKFKTITVMISLVAILVVGFQPYAVSAKELAETSDFNVQTLEFEVDPSVSPASTTSTTYFIGDSEFSFTNSNIGGIFNVPKTCNVRMMVAVVAEDGSANDSIVIMAMNTSGTVNKSLTIPTNQALVETFRLEAGDHYLAYICGRSGVKYNVRISLYTWDY